MKMLYIIGVPGIGKTTIVDRLLKGVEGDVNSVPYVSWTHYSYSCAQLGYRREHFGGTDALGMAAQKHVIALLDEWRHNSRYRYILAEGDRLANKKFFEACIYMDINLTVAALVNDELAEKRREKRAAELGKEQNERWIGSRHTKVQNLIEEFVPEEWQLDPANQRETLRKLAGHPVVRKIRKLKTAQVR